MGKNKEQTEKKIERICPYCEEEITVARFPFCKPCGVTLKYCIKCNMPVKREAEVCPECGGGLEWK